MRPSMVAKCCWMFGKCSFSHRKTQKNVRDSASADFLQLRLGYALRGWEFSFLHATPERNPVKNFMNLHLGHSRNVFHPGNPRTQSTAFSKGFYNGIQWGSGIHVIVLCFER